MPPPPPIPRWQSYRFWDLLVLFLITVGLLVFVASGLALRGEEIAAPWGVMLWFLLVSSLIATLLVLYGTFVEPKRINLNTIRIQKDHFPHLRIAVIGDMHVGPLKGSSFLERVTRRVLALQPDLILLAGDFIYDEDSDPAALLPLRALTAPLGVFAVLGNHDAGFRLIHGAPHQYTDRSEEVARVLQDIGIAVLRNTSSVLHKNGSSFSLAGIDDIWMKSMNLDAVLQGIPSETPAILLAHNPAVILDARTQRFDCIVSGHTHGGQVRLPLLGPIAPLPCALGRRFDRGIFHVFQQTQLIITHGIGETMGRMRFCCTPEIVCLEITPPKRPSI